MGKRLKFKVHCSRWRRRERKVRWFGLRCPQPVGLWIRCGWKRWHISWTTTAYCLSLITIVPCVISTLDTRADGVLECLSKVPGHECIHTGVNTGIEVGHKSKCLPHVLQVSIVKLLYPPICYQDVVDQWWSPAYSKQHNYSHQHLYNLKVEWYESSHPKTAFKDTCYEWSKTAKISSLWTFWPLTFS